MWFERGRREPTTRSVVAVGGGFRRVGRVGGLRNTGKGAAEKRDLVSMDCYECYMLERSTTAVATCRECGVALCPGHLQVETKEIHKEAGLGKTTGGIAARRVVCPTCRRAELSV
ncbi:DUF2180 family protein [Streptomyces sp. AS58]|uniref:DUF2180 family protein n=1 Tax=Streptomyces sp. AS58 TaxID=1519489 RepID=UPI002D218359|nr:DUF2180 family protein [Streptomyces sp. AS58]